MNEFGQKKCLIVWTKSEQAIVLETEQKCLMGQKQITISIVLLQKAP